VSLAARDAATRALDAGGLDEAGCLVVAATPEHLDESIELCAALRDVVGAGAQIVGGATLAAFCPGDAATEEGPALGVLALEQRAHVFSFRVDEPAELRAAAQRAGQGALGTVFGDPAAPLQRPLGALGLSPRPGEKFDVADFISVQLLGVDEERGSLETGIAVPEGHSVSFTLRDGMGARRTLQTALNRLAGPPPAFGIYFDCASRGTTLYGVDGLDLDLVAP